MKNKYIDNWDGTTMLVVVSKTHGTFNFLIDEEDIWKIKDYRWRLPNPKDGPYATNVDNKLLHRFLLGFPEGSVDHMDRNTLNNCKANLREVTPLESSLNRARPKRNNRNNITKCKYRGVSPNKNGKRYMAFISNGKSIYLGTYDTEKEAALVYNKKALELFGDFAMLNIFPEDE